MNREKRIAAIVMIIIEITFVCLLVSLCLSSYYADKQYRNNAHFVNWLINENPENKEQILQHYKDYTDSVYVGGHDYLKEHGFNSNDYNSAYKYTAVIIVVLSLIILCGIISLVYRYVRIGYRKRIAQITEYLANVNLDGKLTILPDVEDDCSGLEDEIYKTVTALKISRENAILERQNYADSLANIAHQIKTPVTSVSVSIQMLENRITSEEHQKLQEQVEHINQLVNALLTVSKIDAGIVRLKEAEVDVYTALELSVEALEVMIGNRKINIVLPNHPEVFYIGDLDWSVEIYINLIKNCIEHTPEHGNITFEYEKNPLYVQIEIRDDGTGFAEDELPYIFNRFYQGGSSSVGSGIGLSLTKSIIEMQNGFITAKNNNTGGASFIIRYYCH